MIKHYCDRCGKEVEWDELILNKFKVSPSFYPDISKEEIKLCPDCQTDLMRWVRNAKETSGVISSAAELIEPMREKIDILQCIGNNMCFTLRKIASGGPIDPNVWLRLGQLMNEWEDKS